MHIRKVSPISVEIIARFGRKICVRVRVLSISDFETEKHTLLRHETSGFEARNLRDFET